MKKIYVLLAFCAMVLMPQFTLAKVITMTTSKEVDETIKLYIDGENVTLEGVEGTFVSQKRVCYVLTSQTIVIKGDVKGLTCNSMSLVSLVLSDDVELESLNCSDNELTSLDVSKQVGLLRLDCFGNKLSSLDVTKNVALVHLDCGTNALTSLDVSKNTALNDLACTRNNISEINVSQNLNLTRLNCAINKISKLDVSKNILLNNLACHSNLLNYLDVSKNSKLRQLSIYLNRLNGDGMQSFVELLPSIPANLYVIAPEDPAEKNVMTTSQVEMVKAKGWGVCTNEGVNYSGSQEPTGVSSRGCDENVAVVAIYDSYGRQYQEIQKGINVLKMSDGTVIKVFK